jgi:uncharacterized membrane protein YgcG
MTRSLTITPNRILQRIPVFFLLAFFVSLLLPDLVAAQIPSHLPDTYVNDFAGILAKEDIADLNRQIDSIDKEYTVQIAIVLVKKLPEDMEIEDFARGIGREWHIGTDRKGLVYVASISQRKQRMEVAANLEGVLTDIITHEIMDHLKPFMKKMDYAGALRNMVSEIGTHLQSEQAATNQSPAQVGQEQGQSAREQAPAATEIPDQTSEQSQPTGYWLFSGFPFFFLLAFVTFIITIAIRMIRGLPLFPRTVSSNYDPDPNSGLSYSTSDSSGDSGSSDSSDSSSSSDSGFDGGGSSNDW